MGTKTDINTKIHLVFFASMRDFFNQSELYLEITEGTTIKELQDLLFDKFGKNKKWDKPILYAVNESYATLETVLKDGDEVVFMPFVSGG